MSNFLKIPIVFQLLSHVRLFATLQTAECQAFWSFTVSWSLFKLMSIELVMLSEHLTLCHPLLLPSVLPSIRVFSTESALCRKWPKYWSFTISPSNELLLLSRFSRVPLCDTPEMAAHQPHSAVPGILQARTLEWVAISFSNAGE